MKRLLALLVPLLFVGCTTYDSYGYRDDGYYEDRYYGGGRYVGSDVGYYSGRSWYPDYVLWSDYYSVLWPMYRNYYDPFYSPGFYYGVTWYPRTYFGLNHYWNSWPYYHAYAPYLHSYWDGYYDRWQDNRGWVSRHDGNQRFRFGSARNEAQSLARRTGASYGISSKPGLQYDPYAAQSTTPLSRAQLRTTNGFNARTRSVGAGEARGVRDSSSGQIRRSEPMRSRIDRGSTSPARGARPAPRQEVRNSGDQQAGWVSSTRRDVSQETRVNRGGAPYYRDINGMAVPLSRPARQSRDSEGDLQPSQYARQRGFAPRSTSGDQRAAPILRSGGEMGSRDYERRSQYGVAGGSMPTRMIDSTRVQSGAPASRYQPAPAVQRSREPTRSGVMDRSVERSNSSGRESARQEVRRSRNED